MNTNKTLLFEKYLSQGDRNAMSVSHADGHTDGTAVSNDDVGHVDYHTDN